MQCALTACTTDACSLLFQALASVFTDTTLYSEETVEEWTQVIIESSLKGLREIARPFKYIGVSHRDNGKRHNGSTPTLSPPRSDIDNISENWWWHAHNHCCRVGSTGRCVRLWLPCRWSLHPLCTLPTADWTRVVYENTNMRAVAYVFGMALAPTPPEA